MKNNLAKRLLQGLGLMVIACLVGAHSYAQSQLNLSVTYASIQALSPSTLDFRNEQRSQWLFTVEITNNASIPLTARLSGDADVVLGDGRRFPNAITLRTEPFVVLPSGTTFTNLDIGYNRRIRLESFTYSVVLENAIRDILLSTGQIPAGTYTMTLRLTDISEVLISNRADIRYEIANVSRLELISPPDGSEVPDRFPFMQWLYSVGGVQGGQSRVKLIINPLLPGQSREDALSRRPAQAEIDLQGQSSYQIPPTPPPAPAVLRPLTEGTTYVWTVVGLRRGSSGIDELMQGEIRTFTVASPATNPALSGAVLNQLEQLLGSGFRDLVNQLTSQNLSPTGRYYVNGQVISDADLRNLINLLLRDPNLIISAAIE